MPSPQPPDRHIIQNAIKKSLRRFGFGHKLETTPVVTTPEELKDHLCRQLELQSPNKEGNEDENNMRKKELSTLVRDPVATVSSIRKLSEVAKLRRQYRKEKGAIIINIPNTSIRVDGTWQASLFLLKCSPRVDSRFVLKTQHSGKASECGMSTIRLRRELEKKRLAKRIWKEYRIIQTRAC